MSKTLALTQAAVAVMAERLEEATGLLQRADGLIVQSSPEWRRDYDAFLSGAPAREAEQHPPDWCPIRRATVRPCIDCGTEIVGGPTRCVGCARAEAAEAKLAAVREAVTDARREATHYTASKWRVGVYEIALAAIEAALRTPAPATGEEGT